MHPTEIVRRLGGVATWSTLHRHCERGDVERLVKTGDLVRDARGRYALPEVGEGLRVAHAVTGTLSLRSAALHHGWEVAVVPRLPDVTVRAHRRPRRRPGRRPRGQPLRVGAAPPRAVGARAASRASDDHPRRRLRRATGLGRSPPRIVLEADSHAFHATRAALRRDCRRSTGLAIRGWLLIRFSWEDVMLDPDYVVTSLRSAVSLLAAA